MLKIIAGEYRSRILKAPPDETVTRPYANRVKEAVFNRLRGWCEDARVLDLFAGVGTMGLEAVSRGAASVLLVERDRKIHQLLQQNIETLDCADRAVAISVDALGQTALARAPRPVDLVFIDPPYEMIRNEADREQVLAQASRCREIMADPSLLILRSPLGPEEIPLEIEGLEGPEAYSYGRGMWVLFYAPGTGPGPGDDE